MPNESASHVTHVTHDIAVAEGDLRVGEWRPDAEGTPWLLVHGEAVRHVLEATAARLDRRSEMERTHRDFRRARPALAGREPPSLAAYIAYDLVGEPPELRPVATFATVGADSIDQKTGAAICAG